MIEFSAKCKDCEETITNAMDVLVCKDCKKAICRECATEERCKKCHAKATGNYTEKDD